MWQAILSILLAAAELYALFLLIQWMGGEGILAASPPARTFGLRVKRGGSKEEKKKGGNVIDVVHANTGMRLVKVKPDGSPEPNLMNWFFEVGEESRDWLFIRLGIVWLGVFDTIRSNTIRNFRFGRKDEESSYRIMAKGGEEKWPHYSGQHDIEMLGIETHDVFGVNMKMNIPYKIKYPVRAILSVADAFASMTIMVQEEVIRVVGSKKLEEIVSGNSETKKQIVEAVANISQKIEDEVGVAIGTPNIFDLSMDEETRKIAELAERTKREMAAEVEKSSQRITIAGNDAVAAVRTAEGRKRAKMLDNDAEADHIERNVNPRAKDDLTVRVTEAEAYKDNTTVTHSVRVKVG